MQVDEIGARFQLKGSLACGLTISLSRSKRLTLTSTLETLYFNFDNVKRNTFKNYVFRGPHVSKGKLLVVYTRVHSHDRVDI